MKAGKLSTEQLKNNVLDKIKTRREEVLIRPTVGEDCTAIDFGEYACILTTDPITGASSEVGRLGVHISCNDVASSGTAPIGLLVTILAPEGTSIEEIDQVMSQAAEEADKLGVEIIGGHTEITAAVNKIVVSTTAIGKMKKEEIVKTSGANVGDKLIITKSAGLEGTGIIAYDKGSELDGVLTTEEIEYAKSLLDLISVVPEGMIAGKNRASALHDVTEGGVLGAVWEMCDASGVGAIINSDDIKILEVTNKICRHYNIDPLKLISSGSMVIAVSKDNLDSLTTDLKEANIDYSIIGEFIDERSVYIVDGKGKKSVDPPEKDELFKVV